MVSVAEAESLVLSSMGRLPAEKCRLKNATGRVLRKAVTADRDGPPFDRSTLDGVCLRFGDWEPGRREFKISGTQAAGGEPTEAPPEGSCLEIMTGAAIPAPCDCVLPVEDYTKDGGMIRANEGATLTPGQGVHRRASDFESGQELLQSARRLTGREIAVAASCGCAEVDVAVEPAITIVTTGNELVEVDDEPKPHEIRRSNDLAMRASLFAAGHTNIKLTHLADDKQAISWALEPLLQSADVIIATGGVSKGRFDFLPEILVELGVKEVFHGVAQRPGKPMWFGIFQRQGDFLNPDDDRVVAVFALPGNPVSAFTCLHRYVLPAIDLMCGIGKRTVVEKAVLAESMHGHGKLSKFVPVRLSPGDDGTIRARPVPFNTSGDFSSVADTDGFLEIDPTSGDIAAERVVPLFRWK